MSNAPDLRSSLDEARTAWEFARRGVIAEVENLPADQFDFRPTPETRSVAELIRHIVESGQMMAGELTRPDGDFQRQSFDEFIREYAGDVVGASSKESLLELLETTHAEGEAKIQAVGDPFMLGAIRQFDGTRASRISWMYHGVSHEEYHRGQLAVYARLLGQTPALTQRIRGG